MKTALVILAAGIGSRFGGGIKQLAPVGPNGELIIDYSIHDALEAGFNKVVFIIRRAIDEDFRRIIGNRIEKICEVEYVYQELENLPDGFTCPPERTKPWGTGHALLACRGVVQEPFVVINADDYYGKKAFTNVHAYLLEHGNEPDSYCMAGFTVKNTLSENGGVTRGICLADESGKLLSVVETKEIQRTADGTLTGLVNETPVPVSEDALASMNMWGLNPSFIERLAEGFPQFLSSVGNDLKAEYLLPVIIGDLLKQKTVQVQMLPTPDRWFGVTYREDQAFVKESFLQLTEQGIYPASLF